MKWVLRILGFLAISVILYIVGYMLMSRCGAKDKPIAYRDSNYLVRPGRDTWARYHEFQKQERHDVIILGSSRAYRGYDPFVFVEHGYTAFNLGSLNQTPMNSYVVLKHFVESGHTGLVVFDVYEKMFRTDGMESTADLVANLPTNSTAAEMAWTQGGVRALNMFALRLVRPATGPLVTDPFYKGLGFGSKSDSAKYPLKPAKEPIFKLSERQDYFFRESLALLQLRGIPVVVTQHYDRKGLNNVDRDRFSSYIKEALDGTGIPFVDLSETPGIEDLNWFADGNHLNATGARIFTKQLVDSLESLGYLKEPRP